MALASEPLRQDVFRAIQASPFRENKLHLRTFLSDGGNRLLDAVNSSLRDSHSVSAILDSLIDLEFYMPDDQHRASWSGGSELIVGSVMDDDGSVPHFFSISGDPVYVPQWESELPETPTLSLVPLETDFSRIPQEPDTHQQIALTSDPGVYMVRANITDSDGYEPSLKGDPEFETHVFVRNPAGTFNDAQCAGEDRGIPFHYDHNDDAENPWDDEVTLILENGIGTNPVQFSVWENDKSDTLTAAGPCTSAGGRPPEVDNGVVSNYSAWGARTLTTVADSGGTKLIQISSFSVDINLADELGGDDDDEVGEVRPSQSCWPAEDGPLRFDLRISGSAHTIVGDVDLDFRFGERTPLCPPPPLTVSIDGPSAAPAHSSVNLTADVSNYTAPVSYSWEKNGSPICGNSSSCSGQIGAGGTYTTFEVTVTDADQDTDSDSHNVFAQFGGCEPCTVAQPDTSNVGK